MSQQPPGCRASQSVDAIINCAGVLHSRHGQDATAIHATSPIALFEAGRLVGISKIVQISAIGIDAETEFARTKLVADEHLSAMDVDWTILRPSIVYGQQAYGGTAMLRALAATPGCVPVIGRGQQTTTPIHVDDLCETILLALSSPKLSRKVIYPCGPLTMRLADMLAGYRGWLGLRPAPELHVPMPLLSLAGRIGDVVGTGPVTITSLRQLEQGTAADPQAFALATGLHPRSFAEALAAHPAGTTDLWHARFYLLRPFIRLSLILLWLVSGMAGMFASAEAILNHLGPLAAFGENAVLLARAASMRRSRHRCRLVVECKSAHVVLAAVACCPWLYGIPHFVHARAVGRPLRRAAQEHSRSRPHCRAAHLVGGEVMDHGLIVKWLHILSSTVLFGTGLGTAFFMWMAHRTGNAATIASVSTIVVKADWLFTLTSGILQPVTGFMLAHHYGYSLAEPWLVKTYLLYALAMLCWLPVVWLQMRMRDLARAANTSTTLPAAYYRYFRIWFWLGWPAFTLCSLFFS